MDLGYPLTPTEYLAPGTVRIHVLPVQFKLGIPSIGVVDFADSLVLVDDGGEPLLDGECASQVHPEKRGS